MATIATCFLVCYHLLSQIGWVIVSAEHLIRLTKLGAPNIIEIMISNDVKQGGRYTNYRTPLNIEFRAHLSN
jgi:hypothetical protein